MQGRRQETTTTRMNSTANVTTTTTTVALPLRLLALVLALGRLGTLTAAQDCLSNQWDEGDPVDENFQGSATQCDVLIPETRQGRIFWCRSI